MRQTNDLRPRFLPQETRPICTLTPLNPVKSRAVACPSPLNGRQDELAGV